MTTVAQAITLTGSIATVTEYLGFAINSILYQRGVYPATDFTQVVSYGGLPLMITTDEALTQYLRDVLVQIADWIGRRDCRRVVLLLTEASSDAVLERWDFHIEHEAGEEGEAARGRTARKTEELVRREVQAIMRQITSCASFLPLMTGPCAFDVLVYTAMSATAPAETWEETAPRQLHNGSVVKLKAFDTTHHWVNTSVAYRS
ncbi:mitotic spindle assembly checkpoint protein MAD2 [Strigomonas culicis]|uniref:Mitotic spindle assembly checkpoint protein MAD2 n=1 Tax=Strigomonas culicis TaxID=28005 RepID=S9V8U9_9TRYP|nr:mitotic spindle assembly checkpoint protein MAD2 [Strigomonas culicis]|eukprot:EPY37218.1 mitotic spindle assembly checkpoint protein MAD2 [Strigomonas culicis]